MNKNSPLMDNPINHTENNTTSVINKTRRNAKEELWLMRTYSGHSTARASNQLYQQNLAKGQTGLSVAFDLPTQTGYDSDHPFARAEVGKVGVPIAHLEDMQALFEGIPLEQMNTSMTINATAVWLLALYVAVAESQGVKPAVLQGTTQNDILKEYLSRGTYIFPPAPSLRLTTDLIAYTVKEIPKWNPINVCPYHLQEAGATPVQELAFGLANAICILDALKESKQVPEDDFAKAVGRISFFMDSSIRFVEEICKVRAFNLLWDQTTERRYGISDAKYRRFRYGVQVNSLGLTERQPENNVQRIVLEMLGVTLSKNARARAIQLPCWNEALGLPRAFDQQWSLRMQQVLAYETDLLEYEDIFEGSHVIEKKTAEFVEATKEELSKILDMGGSVAALDYMKQQMVLANANRVRAIETGEQKVIGVNLFTEAEPSPLVTGREGGILKIDQKIVEEKIESLKEFRIRRDSQKVEQALSALRQAALNGANLVYPSIVAAKVGVTTGEWADTLRAVFGEYRAPTGLGGLQARTTTGVSFDQVIQALRNFETKTHQKLRFLVGKPGLDGHSNGAEQIAVRARDLGMEVIYPGIRLTPLQIVETAIQEDVHVIGLSILSGSHVELITEILRLLKERGLVRLPVVVGGIIPESDRQTLLKQGVALVYTPKDFDLNQMMEEVIKIVRDLRFGN